jgi:hypothetical protein
MDRPAASHGLTSKHRSFSVSCMSSLRLRLKFARLTEGGRIREDLFEAASYAPVAGIAVLRCDECGANHIKGPGNAWVQHCTGNDANHRPSMISIYLEQCPAMLAQSRAGRRSNCSSIHCLHSMSSLQWPAVMPGLTYRSAHSHARCRTPHSLAAAHSHAVPSYGVCFITITQ